MASSPTMHRYGSYVHVYTFKMLSICTVQLVNTGDKYLTTPIGHLSFQNVRKSLTTQRDREINKL